jgi:nitrate/nitrite transport system substrate-binding protein
MTKKTGLSGGTSRRTLLQAGSAAALLTALRSAFPSGAFAQGTGPEVKGAKLGYIALTDACPLIVAKEKGFYAKHGMPDTEVAKQASWPATLSDGCGKNNPECPACANGAAGALSY